jgi:hypothetical protein
MGTRHRNDGLEPSAPAETLYREFGFTPENTETVESNRSTLKVA